MKRIKIKILIAYGFLFILVLSTYFLYELSVSALSLEIFLMRSTLIDFYFISKIRCPYCNFLVPSRIGLIATFFCYLKDQKVSNL
jgi:hypothetical protein